MKFLQRAPGHDLAFQFLGLRPPQHGRLQSTETEVQGVPLHLDQRHVHCVRVAERRQTVQHRAARVAESEQLGYLVIRLPGRVVPRSAQQTVSHGGRHLKQVGVAATGYQGQGRKFDLLPRQARLQQHCVDVALNVIDADQRQSSDQAHRLGIGNPYQQRPHQPGAGRHRDRIQVGPTQPRLLHRPAYHRHDCPQMLA
jgi:hypothetical protein